MAFGLLVLANFKKLCNQLENLILFEHDEKISVRKRAVAVLKKSKRSSIGWPVVPWIDQDLAEHLHDVQVEHVLPDLFALHVAGQIKYDANHQVTEAAEVDPLWATFGHAASKRTLKLLDDHAKDVILHDELGYLFDALLVGSEV